MPVIPEYSLPKGNAGMTQLGGTNDDTTVSLPDIGFNFYYESNTVRILYTSGNSWVGFGSSSEHLKINRRDTSYNKLFYKNEVEYGVNLFRIRFEGNTHYSHWNSNNLVWELSIFETGVIRLVIEKIPSSGSYIGTHSFYNPGVGTQTLNLVEGRSYIFTPNDPSGRNFVIQEGSYIPANSKFLMVDSEGVKTYQASSWVKVSDLPLTEEMFNTYGVDTVPNSLEGLIDTEPLLYHYTDNPDVLSNKTGYSLKVSEIVTSKPKLIVQNTDFLIHDGKTINRFEAVVTTARKDTNGNDIATNGRLRIALSVDSGLSWLTYSNVTSTFDAIDINDGAAFLSAGISPAGLIGIDYITLNTMLENDRKLRFAYILEKPTLLDVIKLRKMKIFYN